MFWKGTGCIERTAGVFLTTGRLGLHGKDSRRVTHKARVGEVDGDVAWSRRWLGRPVRPRVASGRYNAGRCCGVSWAAGAACAHPFLAAVPAGTPPTRARPRPGPSAPASRRSPLPPTRHSRPPSRYVQHLSFRSFISFLLSCEQATSVSSLLHLCEPCTIHHAAITVRFASGPPRQHIRLHPSRLCVWPCT